MGDNYIKEIFYANLEQALLEAIADYLSSEEHKIDMLCSGVLDADDKLHIRMAQAAVVEYKKQDTKLTVEYLLANGFTYNNGSYYDVNLGTHILGLRLMMDDYFYPEITEIQEFCEDSDFTVSVARIQYVSELENIIRVIKGNE